MRVAQLLVVVTLVAFPAMHAEQPSATPASTKPSTTDLAAIRAFYRSGLEHNGIVGSTLVLVDNGRVMLHQPYGEQSLTPSQPVDQQTTYHFPSLSHTFTGIAIT